MSLRVLAVASEMSPLVKTGGLADVVGALPSALAHEGVETRTLIPAYPEVLDALGDGETVLSYDDLFGGPAWVHEGSFDGAIVYALVAPHLYAREGGPYADENGVDYPDNAFRFAALAWAGAEIAQGAIPGFAPDALHAHDWQAALAPAYLHYSGGPRPATIVTIHNIAFQGQYAKELLRALRLPPESFVMDGVEYYGAIGFLKAGLQLCDRITTVSPSYALEIETPEFGMGLDGLLRARADVVSGILNGVDQDVWNPATDKRIPATYDVTKLKTRAKNRAALQKRFQLEPDAEAFLLGVVSRLSWQKGHDMLLANLPSLMTRHVQLALIGAGDKHLEEGFLAAQEAYPGRVSVRIGYSEDLAHLIQAGADAFLAPSRFEPCGLTQLYALRYGAVPIVSRVGGLKDTIIDANEMAAQAGVATGVQFSPPTAEALAGALRQAEHFFKDKETWRKLQINGMKTDVSWRHPAQRYAALYREAVAARG
ncbi:glycogen synthase GlgA [Methylocystis parvus]|uniref:Glycogen synthase n=1 Tax=Methylocystis parvus TaxID=134 RepID=A0A6B8M4E6_9HYPH|nr:glycogen synthase GlgA [Methylocystis parvus]QGM97195.1 glycogen synthase GlgA [Methylocystis parvus]WBJ98900.1 glycogen synthase GlgA [Methylocystis parvus OBBP]